MPGSHLRRFLPIFKSELQKSLHLNDSECVTIIIGFGLMVYSELQTANSRTIQYKILNIQMFVYKAERLNVVEIGSTEELCFTHVD